MIVSKSTLNSLPLFLLRKDRYTCHYKKQKGVVTDDQSCKLILRHNKSICRGFLIKTTAYNIFFKNLKPMSRHQCLFYHSN